MVQQGLLFDIFHVHEFFLGCLSRFIGASIVFMCYKSYLLLLFVRCCHAFCDMSLLGSSVCSIMVVASLFIVLLAFSRVCRVCKLDISSRRFVFLCVLFKSVFAYNVSCITGMCCMLAAVCWAAARDLHCKCIYLSRAAKRGRDIVIGVCVRVCVCLSVPQLISSHVSCGSITSIFKMADIC